MNRFRLTLDIKTPALRKALKMMAAERDSSVREVVLTAIAVAYPAVSAIVERELSDEAIVEEALTFK